MYVQTAPSEKTEELSPAAQRFLKHGHPRWIVTGPPRSGVNRAIIERLVRRWRDDWDASRGLLLTVDRRAVNRLDALVEQHQGGPLGQLQFMGYDRFAQELIVRFWPLVAAHYGIDRPKPEFLAYDVAQYALMQEYRKNPGALNRLTIREQRLIVQLLSTMNLAAGNALDLEQAWSRLALAQGIEDDHEVMQAGKDLTLRFRDQCLAAGVMPFDLQIEAASWLLIDDRVREDIQSRYDTLALLAIDEWVPVMAERLCSLTNRIDQTLIGYCPDGGIRWLLGASAKRSGAALAQHCGSDFRRLCLKNVRSQARFRRHDSTNFLADAAVRDPEREPPSCEGWSLIVNERPDQMARAAADAVLADLERGYEPGDLALLIPYVDLVVAGEITSRLRAANVPVWIDRHWAPFPDDRFSRGCLTALRLTGKADRRASPVEIADFFSLLLGLSPVLAQERVRQLMSGNQFRRRDRMPDEIPAEIERLIGWIDLAPSLSVAGQLETLASDVLSPHESLERARFVLACYEFARLARRFTDLTPRMIDETGAGESFFEFLQSNIVAASSGGGPPEDIVVLTTPSAFLTTGRTARVQYWLDVASPSWREPPLLILSNPQALSASEDAVLNSGVDEQVRDEILSRLIQHLASRCDGEVRAFASLTGGDGQPLDGPLLEGFHLLGAGQP